MIDLFVFLTFVAAGWAIFTLFLYLIKKAQNIIGPRFPTMKKKTGTPNTPEERAKAFELAADKTEAEGLKEIRNGYSATGGSLLADAEQLREKAKKIRADYEKELNQLLHPPEPKEDNHKTAYAPQEPLATEKVYIRDSQGNIVDDITQRTDEYQKFAKECEGLADHLVNAGVIRHSAWIDYYHRMLRDRVYQGNMTAIERELNTRWTH